MSAAKARFGKGDTVRAKDDVICPDRENMSIAGWQGRVIDTSEAEGAEPTVGIAWDSVTLKAMPFEYIEDCERQGLGWAEMYLSPDEVEPVAARDSEAEAARVRKGMKGRFHWLGLDEEGKRIFGVIGAVDPDDEWEILNAWESHLKKTLSFPFEAKISEYQERGPLRAGDRARVRGISDVLDDLAGVLVEVTRGSQEYVFPLCDLTVVGKKSKNYLAVNDYCVWFANR